MSKAPKQPAVIQGQKLVAGQESVMPRFDYQRVESGSHSASFSGGDDAKIDDAERERLRATLQNFCPAT